MGFWVTNEAMQVTTTGLTPRQREIYEYVVAYIESYGHSPTYQEIADNFGLLSLATVHEHLTNLERMGLISKSYHGWRSIVPQLKRCPYCGHKPRGREQKKEPE